MEIGGTLSKEMGTQATRHAPVLVQVPDAFLAAMEQLKKYGPGDLLSSNSAVTSNLAEYEPADHPDTQASVAAQMSGLGDQVDG